jgi:exodeoxyribonuclease V alpha subunit
MQLLQKAGVKTSYCAKMLKQYGTDAVDVIRNDPYRMTFDIPGVGFYFADRIALNLGVSSDDPRRVRACIIHVMWQFTNEGHVFAYEHQVLEHCQRHYQLEPDIIGYSIKTLASSGGKRDIEPA